MCWKMKDSVYHIKKLLANKLQCSVIFFIGFIVIASLFRVLSNTQYYCYSNCETGSNVPIEPLAIHCNAGRLGNQMCSYATLYGLSVLNNRSMIIQACNLNKLMPYFDLQTPVADLLRFEEKNPYIVLPYFRRADFSIPLDSNIIKGYLYPCSYTFFNHVRSDLRKIFRFRPHIQQYAEAVLRNASSHLEDAILVGVHVRRTDYLTPNEYNTAWLPAFEGREVDLEYFQKATKYYRDKYKNVVFVAVSDDRPWCRENLAKFGISVTEASPSPAHDMAILANCNHTIMTYGTFGFWGGYLAGGDVVYFKNFLRPGTWFATHEFIEHKMYLPEWVGIATKYKWQK